MPAYILRTSERQANGRFLYVANKRFAADCNDPNKMVDSIGAARTWMNSRAALAYSETFIRSSGVSVVCDKAW